MLRFPVRVPVGKQNAVQFDRALPPSTPAPLMLDDAPLMVTPPRTNPEATSILLPALALEMIPAVTLIGHAEAGAAGVPWLATTVDPLPLPDRATGMGNWLPVRPVTGSTPPSTATIWEGIVTLHRRRQ